MHSVENFTFTHEGEKYRADIYPDESSGPPWEESDGHGHVEFIADSEPVPRGSVVLWDAPRGRYIYGFGAALVQAAREGWGLNPAALQRLTDKLGKKPTKAQVRAQAVREDMAFLRGYVSDDWGYIGVAVRAIGPDGEPRGDKFEHALWGIESCSRDYIEETAAELAQQCASAAEHAGA